MQIRTFDALMEQYERLVARPNPVNERFYNGCSAAISIRC